MPHSDWLNIKLYSIFMSRLILSFMQSLLSRHKKCKYHIKYFIWKFIFDKRYKMKICEVFSDHIYTAVW